MKKIFTLILLILSNLLLYSQSIYDDNLSQTHKNDLANKIILVGDSGVGILENSLKAEDLTFDTIVTKTEFINNYLYVYQTYMDYDCIDPLTCTDKECIDQHVYEHRERLIYKFINGKFEFIDKQEAQCDTIISEQIITTFYRVEWLYPPRIEE